MKEKLQPPSWIYKLVERFCDPYLWEGISGDLEEVFHENVEYRGIHKARWIYLFQSMGFLRNTFRQKTKTLSTMRSMWLNYFLTAYRSLRRNKAFFLINLTGLIVAVSCSLFALIYINDEVQYDKFHTDIDQIHRLYKHFKYDAEGVDELTFETSGMMGPTMVEEYPEVESVVRINPRSYPVILSYEKKNIVTEKLFVSDSTFFDFFDFKVMSGRKSELLTAPSSIVLSNSLAKSIFGDVDPIGKVVLGLNDLNFTVTGTFQDPPRQSSIQCNAVVSWTTTVAGVGPVSYGWMNNWRTQGIHTFVKLARGASAEGLLQKLPEMMQKHMPERADRYFLKLLPFNKMYLSSDAINAKEGMNYGSITFLLILGGSAFLVFVIASVNYINSSLSRAAQTQVEVGIRKTMGSTRKQLMGRFVAETLVNALAASIVGLALLLIFLPSINTVSGKELPLELLYSPLALFSLLGFIFGICLIVGVYPAFVLSSPPVSSILKSSSGQVGSTGWFRKSLLTLQYFISILLLICTALINQQTYYMENKSLGFDKEGLLVIDIDNEVNQKVEVLESKLLSHPNILSVSTSSSAIGGGSYTDSVYPVGFTGEMSSRFYKVDADFFDTYGLAANVGRTFIKNSIADTNNIIVNQAWIDFVGWDDPIGKKVRMSDENSETYNVIGVVNDFHIHSLATSEIEPMILTLNTGESYNSTVRIGQGNLQETIDHIDETWSSLADRTPLNFYFVDQWFNENYQKENQLLKIANTYSTISIILCGLGLFSLTALLLQQRTKEISIRKVLGASMTSILSLINRQFVLIILVSFAVATPVAYFLISKWLDQFSYSISMTLFPFLFSGIIVLLVSILIVSFLAIKSANVNPSTNLRAE
ncbi:MAG: FtsX-like permease family protein [Cyclobacteriaceae bacterium]